MASGKGSASVPSIAINGASKKVIIKHSALSLAHASSQKMCLSNSQLGLV